MILIRIRPLPISIPFERFHQMALQAKDSNWTGLKVLLYWRIEGGGHYLGNHDGRDFGCQKCCCHYMGSCFYYWYCVNAIKSWSQRAWAVHSKSQITRNDSQVILGVDRLDYTKGLVNRFYPRQCFWDEKWLKGEKCLIGWQTGSEPLNVFFPISQSSLRGWCCFRFHWFAGVCWRFILDRDIITGCKPMITFQVAVPSRTDVREYQELKEMMDKLVGQINGR